MYIYKICHRLLTLKLLKIGMYFFLLWKTKVKIVEKKRFLTPFKSFG